MRVYGYITKVMQLDHLYCLVKLKGKDASSDEHMQSGINAIRLSGAIISVDLFNTIQNQKVRRSISII